VNYGGENFGGSVEKGVHPMLRQSLVRGEQDLDARRKDMFKGLAYRAFEEGTMGDKLKKTRRQFATTD